MSSSLLEAPTPAVSPSKSEVSAGTSDLGVKPFAVRAAPSRLPRNWTESAMISTAWRLPPSSASHSRQSRRPWTATGRPLER